LEAIFLRKIMEFAFSSHRVNISKRTSENQVL
jgi:hypothetical protein